VRVTTSVTPPGACGTISLIGGMAMIVRARRQCRDEFKRQGGGPYTHGFHASSRNIPRSMRTHSTGTRYVDFGTFADHFRCAIGVAARNPAHGLEFHSTGIDQVVGVSPR
jgi:hypothetical protein